MKKYIYCIQFVRKQLPIESFEKRSILPSQTADLKNTVYIWVGLLVGFSVGGFFFHLYTNVFINSIKNKAI